MNKKRVVKTPIIIKKKLEQEQTSVKTNFRDYLNVFEFETTLPGSGQLIKFKPLTIGHLKELIVLEIDENEFNPRIATQVFDIVFEKSVLNEDFNPLDILIPDRQFLLLEIRKKTKGESNKFKLTCPKCKSQSVQDVNFEDIPIIPKKDNINHLVTLTDDLSVTLRFVTRAQELEAYDAFDTIDDSSMKRSMKEAETGILLEAQSIDQIITPSGPDENVDIWDKKYLLENIPQPLYKKLADWHEDNNFGPDMNINISCPHCVYETKTDLTQLDFFG